MPETLLAEKRVFGVRKDVLIPNVLPQKISEVFKRLAAAGRAMDLRAAQLGAKIGNPVGGVEFGAGDDEGYYRRYQNGVLYQKPPAGPCWVHGAILDKYRSLGGEAGLLHYPTTDELTTSDGRGRYNHFERGSIYWTYATGAHEVHGAIRDRWAALGWEASWLGYPTSDEIPFAQDGRVSTFEHGAIYWWPDTGAIELGNIAIRYKGLYCFGETDEASSADEPYLTFGTVGVPASPGLAVTNAVRSQVYDDVDAGDSRPDVINLYTGVPCGLALGLVLMEHDEGNPNLDRVKQGVELAGKAVSLGCGALFGPEAAPVCAGIWGSVSPEIVNTVNDLLGTGDDEIGRWSWEISAKDMILRLRTARNNFWGIEYHWESILLSDGEASYKAYFDVVPV
jgi:LGFP repeat-containing protein